ncbi:organic cation transporter protein-like [Acanthaster planci]|uniref:Organic cation transporter protein-like n=1 Tax=Acanthaster planci TaxID=133434 RepID=A0A8B8A0H6_ACAPL|nr:organic cation transporter protein-like [Acanthaster planci]
MVVKNELAVDKQQVSCAFDDILGAIDEFGTWQKILFSMVPLIGVVHAMNALAQVFMAGEADHWCRVSSWDQANCTAAGLPDDWECLLEKRNASIPYNATTKVFDSCEMYNVTGVVFTPGLRPSDFDNTNTVRCRDADGWIYDTRQYEKTIINEFFVSFQFNLVCDQKATVNLLQSIYFAGFLVGSFVFGSLADWIGRKPALYLASTVLLCASVANVFSPSVLVYMILRFFIAAGAMGAFLVCFVLTCEFVGPSRRVVVGIFVQAFFSLGLLLLSLLAFLIRTWRFLQLCLGVSTVLYFLLYFFIPESARWEVSKGRYKNAERTLRKMAARNKKEFPEEMFSPEIIASKQHNEGQQTFVALFRTPNMRIKTLNLMFYWFVVNMVYYGLGLSTSNLGVDDYLAAAISAFVEFPSLIFSVFSLQYFGRRINLSGTMVLGGVACIITAFLEEGVARTAIAMVGKFGISAAFAIIYVVSGEIFPTPVRSAGMGVTSMSSRISGIISPFLLELGSAWPPFPFVVFGVLSIASGLLSLLLPETSNKKLPETMEEGEAFGKPKCIGSSGEEKDVAMVTIGVVELDTDAGVENPTFEDKGCQTSESSFKELAGP